MSARFGAMLFAAVLALSASVLNVNAADESAKGLNYEQLGADWPGLCQTGLKQSPIDIPSRFLTPYDKPEYEPRFQTLGTAEDSTIFATSTLPHVEMFFDRMSTPMQVTLAADVDGNIFAPLQGLLPGEGKVKRVGIEPAQLHFHAPSEASVDGNLYDGVIHIVNFVKDGESAYCDGLKASGGLGCPAVIGIFLNVDDSIGSSSLSEMFGTDADILVSQAGKENGVKRPGQFDLDSLLPNLGSVATLTGSLTTAPCTEGVFWISLLTPLSVTSKEILQLKQTIIDVEAPDCAGNEGGCNRFSDNNRVTQSLNDRTIRIGNAY
ncbi:hypothetical protein BSKO_06176 [Bryopsis sp. KO-2023]|nr:hypothetical protein BSKO_06176 [Bryopsis sp. KO-2023]